MADECVHDMANPVAVLRAMREMAGPEGMAQVADGNATEAFKARGDNLARFLYAVSVPHHGAGTVMRQEAFRSYAADAGFSAEDVLRIEHDFWRYRRLTP